MKREKAIRKHLSDILAVIQHVLEAVERQRGAETVRERPDVNELVIRIERVMKAHVGEIEKLIGTYGAARESLLKKVVTGALGAAAGVYDKRRKYELSRMLRDDYTALNLAAISYVMLHTFGLSIGEENVAEVAHRHLTNIPPLLKNIRETIPHAVLAEIAEQDKFAVVSDAGIRALNNLTGIWTDHKLVEA